jgi:hypothetical protein
LRVTAPSAGTLVIGNDLSYRTLADVCQDWVGDMVIVHRTEPQAQTQPRPRAQVASSALTSAAFRSLALLPDEAERMTNWVGIDPPTPR